jgi:Arm DNA-binding domain
MRLTDQMIEDARCPVGQKDKLFFDDTLPGFGLRVTAAGKKVFIGQYNVGKTKRRTTLGAWGTELTATQARRKAETLRGQVRDRRDPVAERKAARVATMEAKAKAAAASTAYTVDTVISDWTEHHLSARSASYRGRVPTEMRRALRKWLSAPAEGFARTDAVRIDLGLRHAHAGPGR